MARKGKKHTQEKIEQKVEKNIEEKPSPLDSIFEKYGLFLAVGLSALVGFFVFKDYLLLKKVYLFKDIGSDTINTKWPLMAHFAEQAKEYGITTWSFNQGMGQNIMSSRLKYPIYWWMYLTSKENVPYWLAITEYVKVILGGGIFFAYLRTLKINHYSSVIGALLFAFCGFMILGGTWYNYSTTAVAVALMLYSFELLFQKNKWYLFPISIIFIADSRLYFYGLFLFLYSLFRFYFVFGFNLKKYGLLLGKMAGFGLLGLLMSSPFFIPKAMSIINSPRVSGGGSKVNEYINAPIFAFESAHHYITAILRTFSSDLLGDARFVKGVPNYKGWYNYLEAPIFYSGLLSLFLIPQAFRGFTKRQKIASASFLGLWLLMIVFPYFRYAYSTFAGDYYKTAISLTFPITLILLASYGLNTLKEKKINLITLSVTLVVLLVLLHYPYTFSVQNNTDIPVSRIINSSLKKHITWILFVYFGILLLFNYVKDKTIPKALLLIVLLFELGYLSRITTHDRDVISSIELKQKVGYNDYTLEALDLINKQDSTFYRVNKDYTSGPAIHGSMNDALIQDFYGTMSYRAMNQGNYINFLQETNVIQKGNREQTKWAPGLTRPLLKIFGGVKYHLSKQQKVDPFIQNSHKKIGEVQGIKIFRNQYYLPLAFTYDSYVSKSNFDKIKNPVKKDELLLNACVISDDEIQQYSSLNEFDLKTLPNPNQYTFQTLAKDVAERKTDKVNLISFNQRNIEAEVELNNDKLLFFTIPHDQGWSINVDDEEKTLKKVNIGFSGLLLPKGKHTIKLSYSTPYMSGLIFLGVLFTIVYFVLFSLKNKVPFLASDNSEL